MFKTKIRKLKSQEGVTLWETLLAMFIAMFFVSAISPPLLLAMNNRVQTRRTKQALSIAQQEIERVRLLVESGNYQNADLPPDSTLSNPKTLASTVGPPTSFCGGPGDAPCVPNPSVSIARAATPAGDFYIQTFRDTGVFQDTRLVVFRMGVRVYSRLARENISNLQANIPKGNQSLSISATTNTGNQRTFPLAVNFSDFSNDDLTNRLLQQRRFSDKLK